MDVDIDRSKPNPLRRLLVWFAGFLLTGKVANGYSLTELRNTSPARYAFALANVAVVLGALYYLFVVMPAEYTLFFVAIPLYWVGLRGVFVAVFGGVATVLERLQYYRREHYSS